VLRALKRIVEMGKAHNKPVALCGELASRPLEAMALIALGLRSLSMAPASIGPIKTMILSLHAEKVTTYVEELLKEGAKDLRMSLQQFAEKEGVAIDG
jgi:phosphotransferase system enzyme I (PtsP)